MPEGSFPIAPDPRNINAARDQDGNTYLHELVLKGAPADLIKGALALGADINALNKQNMPPLGLAILKGGVEQTRALLDLGADINFPTGKNSFAGTPLIFNATYLAAVSGNAEKLQAVLDKGGGAFVNTPGIEATGYDDKWTALHGAIRKYNYQLVDALLNAGAFPDAEGGANRETPVMLAIENDSEATVAKLIRNGAGMEYKQSDTGDTPLLYAARRDKRSSASRLVAMGADTRATSNKLDTALHLAAASGMLKLTREIIETRPAVNARNDRQETPVMVAASKGQAEISTALIKAGADLLLTDSFNKTASVRAADSTNYSLRWSLEEAEKLALQKQFENSYKKLKPGG